MSRTTRRGFAKALVVAGAAVPLSSQTTTPLASALTGVVRAQSGQFLSPADLEQVERDFRDYAGLLERLRAIELNNSDEPHF